MSEPIGYIPDVGLKTLTDEKKFCVVNATKFDDTDIPVYTKPQTEPLSDFKLEEISLKVLKDVEIIVSDRNKRDGYSNRTDIFCKLFARAIEKEHGIE